MVRTHAYVFMLLAIDPGTDSGWAIFGDTGRLQACGLGMVSEDVEPCKVYIECPKLRPRGEKNPNAVLAVARNAGEWGGRCLSLGCEVVYITPNDWKGSTPKNISHARVWAALSEPEKSVVDKALRGMAPGKRHNVLDAIGIGLWGVKR